MATATAVVAAVAASSTCSSLNQSVAVESAEEAWACSVGVNCSFGLALHTETSMSRE